jgi:hypothetical protein
MPLPRWITALLALTSIALIPWILWLTFSLPSKQIAHHYDLAWVGFDIALAAMFALTARAGWVRSPALAPLSAATAAMLISDAWFDITTSTPGDRAEAIVQAALAELPLAALCVWVAYDVERAHASVSRLLRRS